MAVVVLLLVGVWTAVQSVTLRELRAEAQRCELELKRLEYVLRKDEELRHRGLDLAARLEALGVETDVSSVRDGRIPVPPYHAAPPDTGWPSRAAVARWREHLDRCNARVAAGQDVERGLPALEGVVARLMAALEQQEGEAPEESREALEQLFADRAKRSRSSR